ncbi:hypothetical protein STEG23_037952 [Scotinomys teguina]
MQSPSPTDTMEEATLTPSSNSKGDYCGPGECGVHSWLFTGMITYDTPPSMMEWGLPEDPEPLFRRALNPLSWRALNSSSDQFSSEGSLGP